MDERIHVCLEMPLEGVGCPVNNTVASSNAPSWRRGTEGEGEEEEEKEGNAKMGRSRKNEWEEEREIELEQCVDAKTIKPTQSSRSDVRMTRNLRTTWTDLLLFFGFLIHCYASLTHSLSLSLLCVS